MSEDLKKIHEIAMKRSEETFEATRDMREQGLEDVRFAYVNGAQWDDDAIKRRKNKPRYEINKIAPAIRQVTGNQRQNTISMKVRPVRDGATQELADIYNGIIRNIENRSKFSNIINNAFKEVCSSGYGAWQITTGYVNDQTFEQDISIKPIKSAVSSVYWDASSTDENNRDANWCMVVSDIPVSAFESKYPKAQKVAIESGQIKNYHKDWCNGNNIRIADYYVREPISIILGELTDGRIVEIDDKFEKIRDELATQNIFVERTRKKKTHKVVHYKISGAEILEGPKEWAGKEIPVVSVYGYNIWIDGKHYVKGMVRDAKDSQRIYNYGSSAKIEITALSKKDPFWMTKEQAKGHERRLGEDKTIQFYNPDPKAPNPPTRTGAPAVQSALIEQVRQSDEDIKSTTGLFAPSLGDNPNQQSGRAILAQQRQGDTGTYELIDNLVKGVERSAEILIDTIPRVYDTERKERILKEDGQSELVDINQTIIDEQTGEEIVLNDISVGVYDVVASNGASYQTKRTEAVNVLTQLAAENPIMGQVVLDLIAKSLDFPFAEELTERIRKVMLSQGVIEPNEKELEKIQQSQPQQPSLAEQLQLQRVQLELQSLAADVDQKELEHRLTEVKIQNEIAETQKTLTDVSKSKAEINEDMQGLDQIVPVFTEDELIARQNNIDLFNQEFVDESVIEGLNQSSINPTQDENLQNQQI